MKKKRKLISVLVSFVMVFSMYSTTFAADTVCQMPEKDSGKCYDSLKSAYEEYSKNAYLQGKFVSISLEEFVAAYDGETQTIEDYLEDEESKLQGNVSLQEIYKQTEQIEARMMEDSFETNDGIQRSSGSAGWYYNCPELSQANAYGKYPKLLDNTIVAGDIVIDQEGLFGLTGHIAIVVGHYYSYIFQSYYVRVVEAISDGVKYGILCDERVDDRDSYVYRVYTTTAKRSAAVSWANSQIGKPYLISLSDYSQENITASRSNWYCSLLCYAAYKAQGINLGTMNGSTVLYPRNLIKSPYVNERYIR